MKDYKVISWLLSFVGKVKGKVCLAVGLGIISNLAVIAIPVIGAKEMIAIFQGSHAAPTQAFFLMVSCGLIRGIARYGEQYVNHDIAFGLLADIREQVFATVRRLGPAKMSGKKSGDLVTTITTDVEALEVFFAHTLSPVIIALATSVVTIVYLWHYHFLLAMIVGVGQVIVGVILPLKSYHQSWALGDAYQQAFVDVNQQVMEDVASLQDIAQYSLQQARIYQLNKSGKRLNQQYKRRVTLASTLSNWSEAVLLATAISILLVSTQLQLPLATVVIGTIVSLSSFGPVLALSGLGSALLTTLASGRHLFALTEETPSVSFEQSQTELADFAQGQLQHVTFSYTSGKNIFSDLSLAIEKGTVIGIGGESGNGKSTLLKLLMRYWDPLTGQVRINQTDIKALTESCIHQIEGVIEQRTFIFEESIAQNIGLGKAGATRQEIEHAAQKAAIHEWIMTLPGGYETKIGGNNRTISDGERQRIGLARLFLHDAPFVLLDEPTSNLDYLNEQAILKTLTDEIKNKTVVLISHRETTLKIADQQYELVHGGLLKK